jgi:hypothetical protein
LTTRLDNKTTIAPLLVNPQMLFSNIYKYKIAVTYEFVQSSTGIRKLVMEVFQNMWFTPVRERPTLDKPALLRKVMNITDVVAKCRDIGLDWFEQLLVSVSILKLLRLFSKSTNKVNYSFIAIQTQRRQG